LELRFLTPALFRFFAACYEHAWFVGFSVAFAAHAGLSKVFPR
jgi:cytosine/uracil/thiamine/allantoin permease